MNLVLKSDLEKKKNKKKKKGKLSECKLVSKSHLLRRPNSPKIMHLFRILGIKLATLVRILQITSYRMILYCILHVTPFNSFLFLFQRLLYYNICSSILETDFYLMLLLINILLCHMQRRYSPWNFISFCWSNIIPSRMRIVDYLAWFSATHFSGTYSWVHLGVTVVELSLKDLFLRTIWVT